MVEGSDGRSDSDGSGGVFALDAAAPSVRMHPDGERFSRLTCVDMWLDNALAAVTSSVVVRHAEGRVTRMQRVHTTAIPLLCDGEADGGTAGGSGGGGGGDGPWSPSPRAEVEVTLANVRAVRVQSV